MISTSPTRAIPGFTEGVSVGHNVTRRLANASPLKSSIRDDGDDTAGRPRRNE